MGEQAPHGGPFGACAEAGQLTRERERNGRTEVLVGVVIPCFNQGEFLVECIESLESQSMGAWKGIVIDDASTDGSLGFVAETARSDRVEVIRLPKNVGVCRARNLGFRRLASIPYLMSLDADDRIEAGYLEKLLERLAAEPKAGVAHGTLRAFGESEERPAGWTWPSAAFAPERRFEGPFIPESGSLFRSSAFAETRGWRREFTSLSEGWDLGLQLFERGWSVSWVRDAEYLYRRHGAAVSENWDEGKSVRLDSLLVRFHGEAIDRELGLRRFLSRRVTPAIRGAIRRGNVRDAWRFGAPALRGAPAATLLSLLSSYYDRVSEGRRGAGNPQA